MTQRHILFWTTVIGYMDFDFGASTLTLSSNTMGGWSGFGLYTFSGFDEILTSVSLASNTGFVADFLTDFSFTSDSITLNMNQGSVSQWLWPASGDIAVFDINSNTVPEPSSFALSALALAGIGAARRRKIT
jgi:hypothetical protein